MTIRFRSQNRPTRRHKEKSARSAAPPSRRWPPPPSLRVAICLPSGDDVKMDFACSLARAAVGFGGINFRDGSTVAIRGEFLNVRSSIIAESRNMLAREALRKGAQYVIFVDSDHRFPSDTFSRLLAVSLEHDLPIIGVMAPSRQPGCIRRRTAITMSGEPLALDGPAEIVGVARVGAGILLVRADVFRRLAEPWFSTPWDAGAGRHCGEDFYLCDRAREAGVSIYVDLALSRRCAHVGSFPFSLDEEADVALVRSIAGLGPKVARVDDENRRREDSGAD